MKKPEFFQFNCTLCGECCRGCQKVWLNPQDIAKLCVYIQHREKLDSCSLQELIKLRLVILENEEHGLLRPRIQFKKSPVGRFCPFLINDLGEDGILRGRCSLHFTEAKPLVCRLAPLAREVDIDTGKELWMEMPPVSGCPGWMENPPPDTGRLAASPVPVPAGKSSRDMVDSVQPLQPARELRAELEEELRWFRQLAVSLPKE